MSELNVELGLKTVDRNDFVLHLDHVGHTVLGPGEHCGHTGVRIIIPPNLIIAIPVLLNCPFIQSLDSIDTIHHLSPVLLIEAI